MLFVLCIDPFVISLAYVDPTASEYIAELSLFDAKARAFNTVNNLTGLSSSDFNITILLTQPGYYRRRVDRIGLDGRRLTLSIDSAVLGMYRS